VFLPRIWGITSEILFREKDMSTLQWLGYVIEMDNTGVTKKIFDNKQKKWNKIGKVRIGMGGRYRITGLLDFVHRPDSK
jgi:hypothetical protein